MLRLLWKEVNWRIILDAVWLAVSIVLLAIVAAVAIVAGVVALVIDRATMRSRVARRQAAKADSLSESKAG